MNMTTHAQLTEDSLSDAIHAHDRKGREGKGIGREGNGGAGRLSPHRHLGDAWARDEVVK